MSSKIKSAFSLRKNLRSIVARPSDNYAALDGLRAMSILMVILYHTFQKLSLAITPEQAQQLIDDTPFFLNWIWNSDKSLDVFFVISGFLIAGLLFREYQDKASINLKSFYMRRFLRLSPVYMFALALYAIAGAPNAENIWANVLYINNFLPLDEQAFPWGWSLAVEEQFYLIFPAFLLLVFLPSNNRMLWLIGLLASSFVVRFVLIYFDSNIWHVATSQILLNFDDFKYVFSAIYDNLYTRYGSFLCGISAAYLHYYHQDWLKRVFSNAALSLSSMAVALGVIGFIMFFPIYDPMLGLDPTLDSLYFAFHRNFFAIALVWVILACLHSQDLPAKLINGFLSFKFWRPIAQLSYSAYLFHYVIVELVLVSLKANLTHMNIDYSRVEIPWLIGCFVVATLMSFTIALFTYLLIEKPFMNMRGGVHVSLLAKKASSS